MTGQDMINETQARESAVNELHLSIARGDRVLTKLRDAEPGTPVLVSTVFRQPSYWLVPFALGNRVLGFARVLGDARVAQIGLLAETAEVYCITGIDATDARTRGSQRVRTELDETLEEPVFVHDGPIGREAWLVEVSHHGIPVRWIFVTPSFVYERIAGQIREVGAE